MKRRSRWMLAMLLGAMAWPAGAQNRGNGKPEKPAKPGESSEALAGALAPDAYIIGADDVLTINVWKENELTRVVPVRPDGKISIPLLNDVQAVGLTPLQLGTLITERLRKFLADPQVTVIVNAINSRKIYITGEMARTGAYPLAPEMTVMQAIATAGGFSQFANPRKIYVLRSVGGKKVKYPFNYKEVLKGNNPEQDILLKPGDIIVVP